MPTSTSTVAASVTAPVRGKRAERAARWWLLAYGVILAAIAFWPVPVDSGSRGLLDAISAAVPWLSYDVIEISANVLLFVPLGALLALVLPRRRWLVLPIALVVSVLIEVAQALFLAQRTSSVSDVIANFSGAVLGLLVVMVATRRSTRSR